MGEKQILMHLQDFQALVQQNKSLERGRNSLLRMNKLAKEEADQTCEPKIAQWAGVSAAKVY